MSSKFDLVIRSRERDLGGFHVRRLLPYATHRMVGPFIFFDHMGPATFAPGEGMDVRPHPHIGLATVTYLFEGKIHHRDSLGSSQFIEPGAVNWMTAGRGIVHSERTPDELRASGVRMNGIQCWVALPEEYEETTPAFSHHGAETLPEFEEDGARLKLLVGRAFGRSSPVPAHSDLFYVDVRMPKGGRLSLPTEGREAGIYLVDGRVSVGGTELESCSMGIVGTDNDLTVEATADCRLMFFGGSPVGPRHIWWNLVSSSKERIEEAKKDWALGPRRESPRFQPIPEDQGEFIALPEPAKDTPEPKGTIM
jgi:redox-sensitive bicupin YhaK (pirin superfamily)